MGEEVRRRLTWVRLYQQTRDVGLTCRRCGITPPTLRKWLRRSEEQGEAGLVSQSRRPQHSPKQKVFAQEEDWSIELRRERNLGARRIQQELRRLHGATSVLPPSIPSCSDARPPGDAATPAQAQAA